MAMAAESNERAGKQATRPANHFSLFMRHSLDLHRALPDGSVPVTTLSSFRLDPLRILLHPISPPRGPVMTRLCNPCHHV